MIAHIAIPVRNLNEALIFYNDIGGKVYRVYPTNAVIDFYGIQLVVHESNQTLTEATMYPRHFGPVMDQKTFDETYLWLMKKRYKGLFFEKLFTRRKGEPSEHQTFFLVDPSNNVIEFKTYKNNPW